ncbi:MAG: RNA-binding cell elongation regulator Jag/EloR [Caldicoprobacterales bacterium]|jgi:spoIIIJ-associated protein|nr:protein jag [Clostridiales bacterium]
MKSVIVTGKTVEEATLAAAIQLAVPRNQLVIEVLEEPVKGILGVFGRQDAKIKASVMRSMGDIARDFLTTLFQKMNLEASVDVTETDDTISVQVEGPNMGILIGHRGETLDAVQYLTSLVVNKDSDNYKKVIIDTENYRSKREETLRKLAKRLAHKVAKTKRKIVLEPMNPFERRVIHSTLQKDPKVTTYSEGEEPYRKVIITLK